MNRLLIALLIIVFFTACGKKVSSIKKYYFQYANFIKPQAYKYEEKKDNNVVMYWLFKTNIDKGDTLLTTYIFDANFKPQNIYLNNISNEGSILKEMFINKGDSIVMTKCQVNENEVYKWKMKPTTCRVAAQFADKASAFSIRPGIFLWLVHR